MLKLLSKGVATTEKEVKALEQVTATIDRAIGHYMADNKLTRGQMAEKLGMSPNTLRSKREGKSEWLLSEFMELSQLTGKTPDELAGFSLAVVN